MSIRSLIIDDEQLSIDVLQWELEYFGDQIEVVGTAHDPIVGIEMINKLKPELVFLDIEMPKMNGLELLNHVDRISFNVIFTTAYDHYALEALKQEALDYLLKPVQKDELKKAIEKHIAKSSDDIESRLEKVFSLLVKNRNHGKIVIPTSEGLEFIKVESILRCESSSNYTYIFKRDKTKILVSKTLKDIEALLPSDIFKRIHKSHLINFNCIERYLKSDGGFIVMEDGSEVPISRNKKSDFLDQF